MNSNQTDPRCGTCGRPCDPWSDTDEGYSHCCNDRVEYPGSPEFDELVKEYAATLALRKAIREGREQA
jgi:hypothetical protein